jgi:SAM-dependent methyltransferase
MSERTHEIVVVKPKPPDAEIRSMIRSYFEAQADRYDASNDQSSSRREQVAQVNRIIANDLGKHSHLRELLAVGAGTGKREVEIRNLSGLGYRITGVDICSSMCRIARRRGLRTICAAWEQAEIRPTVPFDAITFVGWFGHVPCSEERRRALAKANGLLSEGSCLYVDVLDAHDPNHCWGPHALSSFVHNGLDQYGYDSGDVFYRRLGSEAVSFYHCFDEEELTGILEDTGFRVDRIWRVGLGPEADAGGIEGKILVKAEKVGV